MQIQRTNGQPTAALEAVHTETATDTESDALLLMSPPAFSDSFCATPDVDDGHVLATETLISDILLASPACSLSGFDEPPAALPPLQLPGSAVPVGAKGILAFAQCHADHLEEKQLTHAQPTPAERFMAFMRHQKKRPLRAAPVRKLLGVRARSVGDVLKPVQDRLAGLALARGSARRE